MGLARPCIFDWLPCTPFKFSRSANGNYAQRYMERKWTGRFYRLSCPLPSVLLALLKCSAEHFNSGAHSEMDKTVMVIELSTSHDPCVGKVNMADGPGPSRLRPLLGMNLRFGLTTCKICPTVCFPFTCTFGLPSPPSCRSILSLHYHPRTIN